MPKGMLDSPHRCALRRGPTPNHHAMHYSDFAPTGFDLAGLGLPDRQDWTVGPVSITRDSGPLDLSNWHAFLESLPGPEGGAWEVHRFGHWGPGWYEIVLLRPGSAAVGVAEETARALEDSPVLDESDLGERELEEASESWDAWALREAWGELAELLPEDLAEALSEDEDEYLRDRGLDPEAIASALFQASTWESHADGAHWSDYGAESVLDAHPAIGLGLAEVRRRKIEAQTPPLSF